MKPDGSGLRQINCGLNTELRIFFYHKNALGLPKLYSQTLDSIRARLLAQPTTVKMVGPNDNITESDIRRTLTVGPIEDEVLSAAVSVAAGITVTGNDELIAQITSPEILLSRKPRTEVRSRVIAFHPKIQMLPRRPDRPQARGGGAGRY